MVIIPLSVFPELLEKNIAQNLEFPIIVVDLLVYQSVNSIGERKVKFAFNIIITNSTTSEV
jgi:hypothetical protein